VKLYLLCSCSRINRTKSGVIAAKKNQVRLESYLPEMLNNSDIAKLNTVMVDGFRSPQKFTVTQQPTRTTLEAYWKLMQTANASAVILLHNTVSCSFWPDEDHPEVYPSESMTLHHQDTQSLDCGDLIKIKMMCESEVDGADAVVGSFSKRSVSGGSHHRHTPDEEVED
jgi:hypothetical protein